MVSVKRDPLPSPALVATILATTIGAAITMARSGFESVTGVELSASLVEIARRNAQRGGLENLRFVQCDAGEYTDFDRVTHLYLYNPFPGAVMKDVLENLRASFERQDREVLLIYRNPVCDAEVVGSGLFTRERELKPDKHWWHIYRHRPAPALSKR